MVTDAVNVHVRELLAFFDEKAKGSSRHASAIVGVAGEDLGAALLVEYFRSQSVFAEILPDRCTQGTTKGYRLDRWVLSHEASGDLLYQVEIKNWSAHAIGGRTLAVTASPTTVREYKVERWSKEWNGKTFRKAPVLKALTPMRSPLPAVRVEPLVCFWTALHPEGEKSPFFSVPLNGHAHFHRVSVFSMSSYLRTLEVPSITLRMPDVAVRRDWLTRLFPPGVSTAAV
jgi:hypothetical protein